LNPGVSVSVSIRSQGAVSVLDVGGDVDVHTASAVRDALNRELDSGRRDIVVDLERVTFIDSTGLGVLVAGHHRLAADGGQLRVVCAQDRILRLLDITGLRQVLAVHDTVPHALNAAASAPAGSDQPN
jgi:anti-sigma B factor antagonist